MALAVVLAVTAQACKPTTSYPSPPPQLIPTIVGIVDHGYVTKEGAVYVLEDGREVLAPDSERDTAQIGGMDAGYLVLARTTAPKFIAGLRPMGGTDGYCWDGWEAWIAWDLGDSVEFYSGLTLPKASRFNAEREDVEIDGRQAWVLDDNHAPNRACVNVQGQVDWVEGPR